VAIVPAAGCTFPELLFLHINLGKYSRKKILTKEKNFETQP